jgi:hypothetical protein
VKSLTILKGTKPGTGFHALVFVIKQGECVRVSYRISPTLRGRSDDPTRVARKTLMFAVQSKCAGLSSERYSTDDGGGLNVIECYVLLELVSNPHLTLPTVSGDADTITLFLAPCGLVHSLSQKVMKFLPQDKPHQRLPSPHPYTLFQDKIKIQK